MISNTITKCLRSHLSGPEKDMHKGSNTQFNLRVSQPPCCLLSDTKIIYFDRQINGKTYCQCGAAANTVFTTQPRAFVIGSTAGHECPLDHTLRGLSERKCSRHLEETYSN